MLLPKEFAGVLTCCAVAYIFVRGLLEVACEIAELLLGPSEQDGMSEIAPEGTSCKKQVNEVRAVRWPLSLKEIALLRDLTGCVRENLMQMLDGQPAQWIHITKEETLARIRHIYNSFRDFNPNIPGVAVSSERDPDRVPFDLDLHDVDAALKVVKVVCHSQTVVEGGCEPEFPYELLPPKKDWPLFIERLDRVMENLPTTERRN